MTLDGTAGALRTIRLQLVLLRAQRAELAIVVSEQVSADTVVPHGDGHWDSPAKSAYRAGLTELRAGMSAVADQARDALVTVNIAIERAEESERAAAIAAITGPESEPPQSALLVPHG